ncbi:unnamed protein product [Amoebophrya sp. A120]|nr:unnamed protein product [Amoebophrya sp. A120]|eukprot:GSA120T00012204001.1
MLATGSKWEEDFRKLEPYMIKSKEGQHLVGEKQTTPAAARTTGTLEGHTMADEMNANGKTTNQKTARGRKSGQDARGGGGTTNTPVAGSPRRGSRTSSSTSSTASKVQLERSSLEETTDETSAIQMKPTITSDAALGETSQKPRTTTGSTADSKGAASGETENGVEKKTQSSTTSTGGDGQLTPAAETEITARNGGVGSSSTLEDGSRSATDGVTTDGKMDLGPLGALHDVGDGISSTTGRASSTTNAGTTSPSGTGPGGVTLEHEDGAGARTAESQDTAAADRSVTGDRDQHMTDAGAAEGARSEKVTGQGKSKSSEPKAASATPTDLPRMEAKGEEQDNQHQSRSTTESRSASGDSGHVAPADSTSSHSTEEVAGAASERGGGEAKLVRPSRGYSAGGVSTSATGRAAPPAVVDPKTKKVKFPDQDADQSGGAPLQATPEEREQREQFEADGGLSFLSEEDVDEASLRRPSTSTSAAASVTSSTPRKTSHGYHQVEQQEEVTPPFPLTEKLPAAKAGENPGQGLPRDHENDHNHAENDEVFASTFEGGTGSPAATTATRSKSKSSEFDTIAEDFELEAKATSQTHAPQLAEIATPSSAMALRDEQVDQKTLASGNDLHHATGTSTRPSGPANGLTDFLEGDSPATTEIVETGDIGGRMSSEVAGGATSAGEERSPHVVEDNALKTDADDDENQQEGPPCTSSRHLEIATPAPKATQKPRGAAATPVPLMSQDVEPPEAISATESGAAAQPEAPSNLDPGASVSALPGGEPPPQQISAKDEEKGRPAVLVGYKDRYPTKYNAGDIAADATWKKQATWDLINGAYVTTLDPCTEMDFLRCSGSVELGPASVHSSGTPVPGKEGASALPISVRHTFSSAELVSDIGEPSMTCAVLTKDCAAEETDAGIARFLAGRNREWYHDTQWMCQGESGGLVAYCGGLPQEPAQAAWWSCLSCSPLTKPAVDGGEDAERGTCLWKETLVVPPGQTSTPATRRYCGHVANVEPSAKLQNIPDCLELSPQTRSIMLTLRPSDGSSQSPPAATDASARQECTSPAEGSSGGQVDVINHYKKSAPGGGHARVSFGAFEVAEAAHFSTQEAPARAAEAASVQQIKGSAAGAATSLFCKILLDGVQFKPPDLPLGLTDVARGIIFQQSNTGECEVGNFVHGYPPQNGRVYYQFCCDGGFSVREPMMQTRHENADAETRTLGPFACLAARDVLGKERIARLFSKPDTANWRALCGVKMRGDLLDFLPSSASITISKSPTSAGEQAVRVLNLLLGIMLQVYLQLLKMHRAGLMHRDVKAENILLYFTEDGVSNLFQMASAFAQEKGGRAPTSVTAVLMDFGFVCRASQKAFVDKSLATKVRECSATGGDVGSELSVSPDHWWNIRPIGSPIAGAICFPGQERRQASSASSFCRRIRRVLQRTQKRYKWANKARLPGQEALKNLSGIFFNCATRIWRCFKIKYD